MNPWGRLLSSCLCSQDRGYAEKLPDAVSFAPTTLGLALIQGYNSMGYRLGQPQLRSQVGHGWLPASVFHALTPRRSPFIFL